MKKLLLLMAVGALFLCAGCSKKCHCVAKLNGEVVYERSDIVLGEGERCSDYNTMVSVPLVATKVESKCLPQLF
ncbi:MAG: hypothetical protein KA074_01880 [Bacteroidales bacterium]|jgi:uncharacterized protein YcfL|nr:hypothetical protein [Bacteroidales bacterium]